MSEYRLQDAERGIIGPISLETARDLIRSGVVHGTVRVSRDGGEYQSPAAYEELVAFAADALPTKPDSHGSLGSRGILGLLFAWHRTRADGLLMVQDGKLRKDAYLRNGKVVYFSSNIQAERLGQYLLLRGKIDPDELNVALQSMHSDNNRLSDTLVRLGLLDVSELNEVLREQQIARLIELTCWQSGTYEFYAGHLYEGEGVGPAVTIVELVLQLLEELPEDYLMARLVGRLHVAPQIVDPDGVDELALSELQHRIVDSVDGKRNGVEIISRFRDDASVRRQALGLLYLLSEIDCIQFPEDD